MKSFVVFLLVAHCVTAGSKSDQKGIVMKRRTFESFKNHRRFGIQFSENTTIDKYPYTAAILTADNRLIGGGMIYKRQWIITSGSVRIRPAANITVRVGSTDALDGGQLFNVMKMFNPPLYEYCATLLKLDGKIKFGKTAKSIPIARKSWKLAAGRGNVTGFGQSAITSYENKLQCVHTRFYEREVCRDNWWAYTGVGMRPVDLCAFTVSCYGDEGDPLVQNGKAVGLFINSVDCSRDDVPVIFCDLRKLRKWIALIIRHDSAAGVE